jgi:hypothetical protein
MEEFFSGLTGVLSRLSTDPTALDDYEVSAGTVELFLADYCNTRNLSGHSITNVQGN